MRNSNVTIQNLLRLLIDLYENTQSPILTKDALRSRKGNRSIFNDYTVGSSYKIEVFIELGIFKVLKRESERNILVVWGTRYPDLALATELFEKRTRPNSTKYRAKKVVQEKQELSYPERNSGIDRLDDFTEENLDAFIKYSPNGTTIPKLTQALLAFRKNTKNGFCHRDKMYFDEILNEHGNFETVDCSPDNNYNPTRLTSWNIAEINPENGKEYRFIAEPKDFNVFVRQLAFYVHNYRNGNIGRKETPVVQETQEEVLHLDVDVPENDATTRLLQAVDRLTEQVSVITDEYHKTKELYQRISAENRKAHEENQKNLVQIAELTQKLNVRLGVKNNLTHDDNE